MRDQGATGYLDQDERELADLAEANPCRERARGPRAKQAQRSPGNEALGDNDCTDRLYDFLRCKNFVIRILGK